MKCRKILVFSLFVAFFVLSLGGQNFAQMRQRVVSDEPQEKTTEPSVTVSQAVTPTRSPVARPILTNEIRVVSNPTPQPLVKKIVSSTPTNPGKVIAPDTMKIIPSAGSSTPSSTGTYSLAAFNQRLMSAMQSRIGIPYHYGSDGPRSYDCSGLVWSVFQDAGLPFTRTSAATYYKEFEPVYGDERFKFGTLVFFNGLGHVGIVIDENTFYQASSSKGVTFTPFAGYWEKRIVGYRRIPTNFN